jgi:hypothetical protein
LVPTALLLFCCNTIPGDVPKTATASYAITAQTSRSSDGEAKLAASKPDAPAPKTLLAATVTDRFDSGVAAEPPLPPILGIPLKPATAESYETPAQRKAWYGLMIFGHGAAAFDGWTTRRAIGGGYAVEGDPLERPFANSGAIYATTQVTPLIMDFVGHRMMRSSHSWVRKAWWVPQAASGSVSLAAGMHNYRIAP